MDFSQFHFEQAGWLWGLLLMPILALAFWYSRTQSVAHKNLEALIDAHLLPHVLVKKGTNNKHCLKSLILFSLVWMCLMVALAGPRWNFHDVKTFTSDQTLVILLDLSTSMDAEDIKPSRLTRAKQEIEDLVKAGQALNVGLIGFAAMPHMVNPITDDRKAIQLLLPAIDTDLVYKQGSRLTPALEMAERLLSSESGTNKSILVMTDGGYEDNSAIKAVHQLAQKGITIHAMGFGTEMGAPIPTSNGFVQANNKTIMAKLERTQLETLAKTGKGLYVTAHFSEADTRAILSDIEKRSSVQGTSKHKSRQWYERFYLLLIPIFAIVLWWFRTGVLYLLLFGFVFLPSEQASASSWFLNKDQQAKQAMSQEDYQAALEKFSDPYRQGVAAYRLGDYAKAEKLFRDSKRERVQASADYNLGNSLFKQQKIAEAIKAYEEALALNPGHAHAKHNLELAKQMQQQQQEQQNSPQQQQDKSQQSEQQTSEQNQDRQNQQQDSKQNKEQDKQAKSNEANSEQKSDNKSQQSEQETQSEEQQQNKDESEKSQSKQAESKESNQSMSPQTEQQSSKEQTAKDINADQWLNRLSNDPKTFLKNQFYIESKRNPVEEGIEPW